MVSALLFDLDMTKEEIINLANRCSRKIWEICMEEPGFSINDCPEGANGLSDIVLNVILKEFPATKKCSSIPSNLDEAAIDEAAKEYAKTTFKKPYSDNPDEEVTIVEPDKYAGFIAGAKWDREQMMGEAVPFYEILKAVPPGPERENVRIIIVKEDSHD